MRETWANLKFIQTANGLECDGIVNPITKPHIKPVDSRFNKYGLIYKADGYEAVKEAGERWIPAIYMPRWASRVIPEITGVRVERVRDITNEDARAEGCAGGVIRGWSEKNPSEPYEEFSELWDSINAQRRYSWESNPFVWVLSFKVITPANNAMHATSLRAASAGA